MHKHFTIFFYGFEADCDNEQQQQRTSLGTAVQLTYVALLDSDSDELQSEGSISSPNVPMLLMLPCAAHIV